MTSTPRLRVLAGPSPSQLTDISRLVNTNRAHSLTGAHFEGSVVVHIKGFPGAPQSEYFEREEHHSDTWSIQVQGRFLRPHSADDVLFGNTFDRPLRLPWGSSAALKFMNFIDPTLEHDLTGPKPWALSPLISTMPHFVHAHRAYARPFPLRAPESISDDTSQLFRGRRPVGRRHGSRGEGSASGGSRSGSSRSGSGSSGSGSGSGSSLHGSVSGGSNASGRSATGSRSGHGVPRLDTASKRRVYFSNAMHRQQITFGPDDVLTTDFCYGFLSFPSLALTLPGGISFDLKRYWDGQPVRFVCVERQEHQNQAETMFWCIVIEAAA